VAITLGKQRHILEHLHYRLNRNVTRACDASRKSYDGLCPKGALIRIGTAVVPQWRRITAPSRSTIGK
jgi:hypothetical protein